MALNLSKTGIVDGQVITAAQITQSIDALTAAAAYNITISGSFSMGSSTTGSGYYASAVAADSIRPQSAGGNTNYVIPFLATTASVSAIKYSATGPTYNPSTDIVAATSSMAVTASYALTTGTVNSVSTQIVQNGITPPIISSVNFIAGSATLVGVSPTTTITLGTLAGKILGTNVFVTATYSGSANIGPTGNAVYVDSLNAGTGALTFSGTTAATFYFHIMYF